MFITRTVAVRPAASSVDSNRRFSFVLGLAADADDFGIGSRATAVTSDHGTLPLPQIDDLALNKAELHRQEMAALWAQVGPWLPEDVFVETS